MQFRVHGRITGLVRANVARKARLLERRLVHVQEDLKALDVTVQRQHRDGSFTAKLVLTIPDRILAASGAGQTAVSALAQAFDDLGDQLDANLARMRRVPLIRRQRLAWRRPSAQLNREEAFVEREEAAAVDELAEEFAIASDSAR